MFYCPGSIPVFNSLFLCTIVVTITTFTGCLLYGRHYPKPCIGTTPQAGFLFSSLCMWNPRVRLVRWRAQGRAAASQWRQDRTGAPAFLTVSVCTSCIYIYIVVSCLLPALLV